MDQAGVPGGFLTRPHSHGFAPAFPFSPRRRKNQPLTRPGTAPIRTPDTSPLARGISELYTSGLYADLTVICAGYSFKVHKLVLHTQSSVFAKMLGGEFKEANEPILTLHDDKPFLLAVVFRFLYTFTYHIVDTAETAVLSVEVYAIADKYDIPGLRSLAAARLASFLDPSAKDLTPFFDAIRTIDECTADTDGTLWDVVLPKIIANIDCFTDNEDFLALLQELPVLNKKLLKTWPKSSLDPRAGTFMPPRCSNACC